MGSLSRSHVTASHNLCVLLCCVCCHIRVWTVSYWHSTELAADTCQQWKILARAKTRADEGASWNWKETGPMCVHQHIHVSSECPWGPWKSVCGFFLLHWLSIQYLSGFAGSLYLVSHLSLFSCVSTSSGTFCAVAHEYPPSRQEEIAGTCHSSTLSSP